MADPALLNPSRRSFFLRGSSATAPLPLIALDDRCFALRGVHCESCRDSCEAGALRFAPQLGQLARPVFDADVCTACGECAALCPADAIRINPQERAHA